MAKARKEGKIYNGPQDFTVNDFANSVACKKRSKKPTNSISFTVKNELTLKDHWDDSEEDEDQIRTNNLISQKKDENTDTKPSDSYGVDYPFDIWFLISNYIKPEDVGLFASICKTSLEVVLSPQFWSLLYKRLYKKDCLPEEFQPECILRYCGLRTSVIKALYYMYPPFVARVRQKSTGLTHPDILKGLKCIGLSFKKEEKTWSYYIKFKAKTAIPFYRNQCIKQDLIEILNDIHANPDEGHCILQVTSKESLSVPPIIGQTLKHVSLTLSKGFCEHRLQLMFGSEVANIPSIGCQMSDLVVMDPVSKIIILHWWHPMYLSDKRIPFSSEEF